LAVEDLFPWSEIQAPGGDRDDDFAPHDRTFQVGVGIVLAGSVVVMAEEGIKEVFSVSIEAGIKSLPTRATLAAKPAGAGPAPDTNARAFEIRTVLSFELGIDKYLVPSIVFDIKHATVLSAGAVPPASRCVRFSIEPV
jgi:hypothetical protein